VGLGHHGRRTPPQLDLRPVRGLERHHLGGHLGGGLARYDGRTWTTYSKRDGLASNAVTCIREDSQGRLWIGTDHGLTLYDGQRFTKAGLTGKSILTLHVDADDNVWAGTWRSRLTGGGLHRYDGRQWQSFGKRDGLPGVETEGVRGLPRPDLGRHLSVRARARRDQHRP
jgi:ligand-binding sensor domain-containing protein